MTLDTTRRIAVWLAVAHTLVVIAHDAAHVSLGVLSTSAAELAFIAIVIHAGPVLGAIAMLRGRAGLGAGALVLSLAASLAFGVHHHFVVESADHVHHLPPGAARPVFQVSAALLALLEGGGAIALVTALAIDARAAHASLLAAGRNVVLVDGECVLCNRIVATLLRADTAGRFAFAHLQSDYARAVLARHGAKEGDVDGVYLLVAEGTPRERLLLDGLAGREIWLAVTPLALAMRLVPLPLLDAGYRFVSRIRYRVFGRAEGCVVPTASQRARFVTGVSAPA